MQNNCIATVHSLLYICVFQNSCVISVDRGHWSFGQWSHILNTSTYKKKKQKASILQTLQSNPKMDWEIINSYLQAAFTYSKMPSALESNPQIQAYKALSLYSCNWSQNTYVVFALQSP